jgi:hypothetical protein
MSRTPRDRDAERATIRAAISRLLTGIPLHSTAGKLTATELITESALRRDVVYEHGDLVDEFKARVKAQHTVPATMQQLTDDYAAAKKELTKLKEELANEQSTGSVLRRIVAELSLELQQSQEELAATSQIVRLPVRSS